MQLHCRGEIAFDSVTFKALTGLTKCIKPLKPRGRGILFVVEIEHIILIPNLINMHEIVNT